MARGNLLQRLRASESGATLVEFAIVSGTFLLLMCATIEYGLMMMTKIAIESVTQEVSRGGSLGAAYGACPASNNRTCVINAMLKDKTFGLINPAYVQVASTVVSSPTTASPPTPDLCTDTPNVPYPATCTFYLNNDGVAGYQKKSTTDDFGGYNQMVELRVTYTWVIMMPLMKPFFPAGTKTLSSTTVVRNEPL